MLRCRSWGLLALTLAVPAGAGDITEAEFLASLDDAHPALRAMEDGVARAEAARRRAGLLANPRFEVWREQPDSNPTLTNWTLAWTPPLDGRLGLGKQAADAGVAAAREQLALERAALRRELRRIFADWSLGHERRALLSSRLERVATLASQERERARIGEESGLAARRLALAEAEVRAAFREAEAGLAQAEAEAHAWQPGPLAGSRPVPPELPAPREEEAAAATPEVRSAQRQLEQAQLEQRLSGRFWGFPTLQAGVQRLDHGGAVRSGPILAASWAIPLFDRRQDERAETERRVQVAASRLERTRALTEARVRGGSAAYRALHTAVREAADASSQTDRVSDAAAAAYRAGEATLTDLLDALRSAFETRLRELELRRQALAAHRELELALGRPLVEGGAR